MPLGQGARPGGPAMQQQFQGEIIKVYCTSDHDEIGIRTLVGEYKEEGANHGRKYYKKSSKIPGHEEINVFLYFWDERDGASFSGWWFGNQVGGAQVWSRNAQPLQRPPQSGWTIPWDGEVKEELVVELIGGNPQARAQAAAVAKKEERSRQEQSKTSETVVAEWEARVIRASTQAAEVELDVNEALDSARAVLDTDFDDHQLLETQKELASWHTKVAELHRFLGSEAISAQKAPAAQKAEMAALVQRAREVQATLKKELQNVKDGNMNKAKRAMEDERRADDENRERELEEGYVKQLEEMLPPAMEKTDAAEEEIEKVSIAAAPLQIDSADDLRPVMLQAIKETEAKVRAAQSAINEGRRYISAKLAMVGSFAPNAKKTAVDEFTALRERLQEAQSKVDPYKSVRQDYEQRSQMKKLHEELSNKVSGAEIEVEKAAMMTAPMGGDTNEGIKETEEALGIAQTALSQTLRAIDAKLRGVGATGPLKEDIRTLQERAKTAQGKLDEVRRNIKESQVRIAADNLLKEVSEKVAVAEDELQTMAEAELPFLKSSDQNDMDNLIAEADKIATRVHTAISEAQTFVARKMVEVARFSEGPAKTVKEEVDLLNKRLDEGRIRLQQFRAGTADRKRAHMIEEVEQKVKVAEDEVGRMAESTKGLTAVGSAGDLASDAARESVDQANLAERAAQTCLVDARKHLTQKTQELKKLASVGAGSGAELGRLQTRINNVQQEVMRLRNIIKQSEERLQAKIQLVELAERLSSTEADVDKVGAVAVAVKADEQPSPEQIEKMEHETSKSRQKLFAVLALIDVKMKSASGAHKEELSAMRAKTKSAEKKLEVVTQSAREQKERLICAEIISEATEHVDKAEAEVTKTGEAELPFLKGVETLPPDEAAEAVVACEVAAASAQKAVAAARTYVVQKLVDVREFSQAPSSACSKELGDLQKRLDTGATKLADLKRDTAERKRTTQMQASGQKVTRVEQSIQALATAMKKFPEDNDILSGDKAHAICQEIGKTENEANVAVADARKFLAMRVQDAKTAKGSSSGVDLVKLQTRLTQCQVELAKLSKQCTEKEQKFVAQKLIQDATENMAKLRREIEDASAQAKELIGDDRSKLLARTFQDSFCCAILAYIKSTESSVETLFGSFAGKQKQVSQADFVEWLKKAPETINAENASLTLERATEIANQVAQGGKVSVDGFKNLLRERYVVSVRAPTFKDQKGKEEVGHVEVGEGLLLIDKIADGSSRANFELLRDGSKVWIDLESVKSGIPFTGKLESIEAVVKAVHQRCTEASQGVDQKTVDLVHVKQGPLVVVKTKLQDIRTALATERAKVDTLRKRATACKADIIQQQKDEVQKVAEANCKAFADRVVVEGEKVVKAAELKLATVLESAKAGSAEKLQKELSISQLDGLKSDADGALSSILEAKSTISRLQEHHEVFKGSRNLLLESRVQLTKQASRAATAERKLKGATEAVRVAYAQVVKEATLQARNSLRAAARKLSQSTDDIFEKVSGSKGEITQKQFSHWVKSFPDHNLKDDQVRLVYNEFGRHGLRRPGFAKLLQEFCVCEKAMDLTKDKDPSSEKMRKLERTEMVEIVEGPLEIGDVKRVKGRALRDGAVGWITVQVGLAAPALKPREKPFLCSILSHSLLEASDPESKAVRQIQQDEVMELIEGPRPREVASELALHACASKDGRVGWVTLRDAKGNTLASASKNLYVCKSTIAMTDEFDIKNCKVVRKVDVGEALEVIGQEKTDDETEISRLRFRALRDGKQGWVTLKGNVGTVYVQLSDSHYMADGPLPLRAGPSKDSQVFRVLEKGEAIQAKEPAKEVKPPQMMMAMVRPLEDGKSGWVVFHTGPKAPVKPWKAKYVCKAPVDITVSLNLQEGVLAVRKAEAGQIFQVVDGPGLDSISGQRRVCLATAEDGAVGWASLRGADGKSLLEVA